MGMASRLIHLAITDLISKEYEYKDKNRLALGSILPDASISGNSHLKTSIDNGTKKTYDLAGFRSEFLLKILEDDLYLGYYLHLVQDMYFRNFIYNSYNWNPLSPGNVEKLHNDYALINQYVIQKYALSNTITFPDSFDKEPLNKLGRFSIYEFLADMKADFQMHLTGTTFFFTKAMADEFIAYACEKCKQEIYSLFHDLDCLDERALAWKRR